MDPVSWPDVRICKARSVTASREECNQAHSLKVQQFRNPSASNSLQIAELWVFLVSARLDPLSSANLSGCCISFTRKMKYGRKLEDEEAIPHSCMCVEDEVSDSAHVLLQDLAEQVPCAHKDGLWPIVPAKLDYLSHVSRLHPGIKLQP